MSDQIEVKSGGLGFSSILTIIFVLCKLFHVINWAWWVVFLPIIISFSIGLLFLAFALVVAGIAVYVGTR